MDVMLSDYTDGLGYRQVKSGVLAKGLLFVRHHR